jgi:hypothetical protein
VVGDGGGDVIALVHPTYAVPCLAIAAGIALGSWRAHMRMPPVALEALGASVLASAAVAAWIWWVAIRGGERRAIITHSDEFLHHGARAILMYPWAPVFGRGYVLVAILCLILLVRFRDLLPAAGAMLAPLTLLLLPGLSTAVLAATGMGQFHRFWQVLPWPLILPRARAWPRACWESGAAWRWRWCWRWCWIRRAYTGRSGACPPASSWWRRCSRWWWRCGCGRGGWSRAGPGGWPRCWSRR